MMTNHKLLQITVIENFTLACNCSCYFAPEHKSFISVLKKASEKDKLNNFDMFNNFNKLKEKN